MEIQALGVNQSDLARYKINFERANKYFNDKKFDLALPAYKSCIPLVKDSHERTRCSLKIIACELYQSDYVKNPDDYVNQLGRYEKSGSDTLEFDRLKLLVLLSEKSSLKIDMLITRAQIFNLQPWPRNANPYARCLLDAGVPKKAIELLLPFSGKNMLKYVATSRLVILADCYDMLDEFDKAIHCLQQISGISDNPSAWIKTRIKNLETLNGSCTEFGSNSAADIYRRIDEGDSSVIYELGSKTEDLTDKQVTPYISAVAALKGTPEAILVAKQLFSNLKLTPLVRCRALNFLIPFASNSLVQEIELPASYEFLELALIKCASRQEFITWLKQCKGGAGVSREKIINKILAAEKYQGGSNACSFNGESFIHRKNKNSKKLVIAFCGLHGDLFRKAESLTYLLEEKDFSVLWLNDKSGNNFLTGLDSFGTTPFEVISTISSIIKKNGYKEVVCIGASSGGAAAAFAGYALKAKKVVGLSPATYLERNDEEHALKIAGKFLPYLSTTNFSLKDIYSNSDTPLFDIYYGEKSKPDQLYAEHMKGIKGVSFYPVKGWRQHAITDKLIRIGEFEDMVEKLFVA